MSTETQEKTEALERLFVVWTSGEDPRMTPAAAREEIEKYRRLRAEFLALLEAKSKDD